MIEIKNVELEECKAAFEAHHQATLKALMNRFDFEGFERCRKSKDSDWVVWLAAWTAARPAAAPAPSSDQDAFVTWLSTNYPRAFSAEDALQMWLFNHVAALAWRQGKPKGPDSRQPAGPLVLTQADVIQMVREAGCCEFRENTFDTAAFPWGCEIEIDALLRLVNAILERAAQYFETQSPQGSVPETLRAMKVQP